MTSFFCHVDCQIQNRGQIILIRGNIFPSEANCCDWRQIVVTWGQIFVTWRQIVQKISVARQIDGGKLNHEANFWRQIMLEANFFDVKDILHSWMGKAIWVVIGGCWNGVWSVIVKTVQLSTNFNITYWILLYGIATLPDGPVDWVLSTSALL